MKVKDVKKQSAKMLAYGVPQDRDRILLFGIQADILGNTDISKFPWSKYQKYELEKIKILPWPTTNNFVNGC